MPREMFSSLLLCTVVLWLAPGSVQAQCPGAGGDCCLVGGNGTPGCDDLDCCNAICAIDPFCCDTVWDDICADEAAAEPLCGCVSVCAPGSGACCIANGTPGCEDPDCCNAICDNEPFCCSVSWDGDCAAQAVDQCTFCTIINVPADQPTIQAAINAAVDGVTEMIVVAPGTYVENIDFLGKAITLRSSGGAAVTTIDGGGSGAAVVCVSGEGPDTVLDGFTITGGNAAVGGGMYNLDSSPTVTDCTFSGNEAPLGGGGMWNSFASPTVTKCTFSGNTAFAGGGMSNNEASPTVTNCTFTGNTVENVGGGMYNFDSSPTVTNCAFSANTATIEAGGMYNQNSSPVVTNSILWGDSPDEIVDDGTSTTTATYSNIAGGFPGAGNIDADPLFVDPTGGDLRLQPGSPCIDAGNSTALPGGLMTDLDGNTRNVDDPATPDSGIAAFGATVDMGAYELNGEQCPSDSNGDGLVNIVDLLALLAAWGACP